MSLSTKPKVKVAIVGSTGYTGLALLEILVNHPNVEIDMLGSEQYAGKKFSEVYPAMQGLAGGFGEKKCEKVSLSRLKKADLIFFATPNGIAHKLAPKLAEAGKKIIDLSADYRFRDHKTYEKWYGFKRKDLKANKNAVYGLVEFKRDEINKLNKEAANKLDKKSKAIGAIIGNPGCYTTASILALAPILKYHYECAAVKKTSSKKLSKKQNFEPLEKNELCDLQSIIIDAKSGISGAGRKASTGLLYTELNDSVSPYNLANQHRHTPELEMFFSELTGEKIQLSFSPHLMPMTKGLLATCYINLNPNFAKKINEKFLRKIYLDAYGQHGEGETFIEVLDQGVYPKTKWVLGTNRALVQVNYDERLCRLIVTCAIDNLMKGAAGQAVHNMNLLLGLPETTGLDLAPQLP